MRGHLANPITWVGPTIKQALADEAVARLLLDTPISAHPYAGRAAVDAAMSKLQQATEKALKAAILALAPASADLVFYPHRLLSEADLPQTRRFKGQTELAPYLAEYPEEALRP